jgi:hypothetical protein
MKNTEAETRDQNARGLFDELSEQLIIRTLDALRRRGWPAALLVAAADQVRIACDREWRENRSVFRKVKEVVSEFDHELDEDLGNIKSVVCYRVANAVTLAACVAAKKISESAKNN